MTPYVTSQRLILGHNMIRLHLQSLQKKLWGFLFFFFSEKEQADNIYARIAVPKHVVFQTFNSFLLQCESVSSAP